jgi:hypothetical protein
VCRQTASVRGVAIAASMLGLGCGWGPTTSLQLSPDVERTALGVGLSQALVVRKVECPASLDHPDCRSERVAELQIEIEGDVAELLEASPQTSARLVGVTAGEGTLLVDAPDLRLDEAWTFQVVEVASSRIALRSFGGPGRATTTDHAYVLAESIVLIAQDHAAADGEPLLGQAPYDLSAALGCSIDDDQLLTVGPDPGLARVTTSVGGRLDLTIVAFDDVAAFDVVDDAGETHDALSLTEGSEVAVQLVPRTAEGRALLGAGGPTPEVVAADSWLEIEAWTGETDTHRFWLEPLAAGTTTLSITWGHVQREIAVAVTAKSL